jgi:hypothetical protein
MTRQRAERGFRATSKLILRESTEFAPGPPIRPGTAAPRCELRSRRPPAHHTSSPAPGQRRSQERQEQPGEVDQPDSTDARSDTPVILFEVELMGVVSPARLPDVKAISRSIRSGGFGAHSGPCPGDPRSLRVALNRLGEENRLESGSKAARFTSSPLRTDQPKLLAV